MEFIKKTLKRVNFKYLFLMTFLLIFGGLTYRLLFLEQITGTEFVALIVAVLFTCLIINFLNEIQELSIGGNLVKLREVKSEVNEAIEQLKLFRIEAFRLFLRKSAEFPGGWGTIGFIDDRAENFLAVVKQTEDADVFANLKKEINFAASLIIKNHLRKLFDISPNGELKKQFVDFENNYPSDRDILIAVKDQYFDDASSHFKWDSEKVKKEFNKSIEIYINLLIIKKNSA